MPRMLRPNAPPLILAVAALLACDSTRFREVEVGAAAAPPAAASGGGPGAARVLRFSVAAVESPRDTYAAYSRLFERMGERLGVRIEFVQRRTYREVNDLLASGRVDAALVCTGGYLDLQRRAPGATEVVAVPLLAGEPTYRSLVIVRADSPASSMEDLERKRFAYTDELSFSGRAYVLRWLVDHGHAPGRFFASTIYTNSHDRSVSAVLAGIVEGAAVHSAILDHMLRDDPSLSGRLRVIHRSPPFGAMPVVASTALPRETRARLREVLVSLASDPEGAAALRVLAIDGFEPPRPGLYASAQRVVEGLW
jgi:phosphonate transport system substrate-binding protein